MLWYSNGTDNKLLHKITFTHHCCADLKQVPVVVLVLEGGHMTLNTAYHAIKTGTPVLVLAGSGRAADFIARAYENPLVRAYNRHFV